MGPSISSVVNNWSQDDLGNLGAILGIDGVSTTAAIEDRLKWLYHSRMRAGAESAARNLWQTVTKSRKFVDSDTLRTAPTYMELLRGACAFTSASENDATLYELELFLSLAVIIAALQRMKPRERLKFFAESTITEGGRLPAM